MVLPVSDRLATAVSSETYDDRVNEVLKGLDFTLES